MMEPTWTSDDGRAELYLGDCLGVMRGMLDASVDAIVTDPPYGLEFMGKEWDRGVPGEEFWSRALRVAKPGAYLLAFGGTRTFHRLACAIEDAGWEIRDCLSWLYGQGFPKSLDVSKAIDKAAGAERAVIGPSNRHGGGIVGNASSYELPPEPHMITAPATDEARDWQGWGTALKPAWEPIIMARKPLIGTVAANVLEHGTGAINVDGCRIGTEATTTKRPIARKEGKVYGAFNGGEDTVNEGRWPANVILDEEAGRLLDAQPLADSGGASRFFYCPKPSTAEREAGLFAMPKKAAHEMVDRKEGSDAMNSPRTGAGRTSSGRANTHPTVKPVELMRWLIRLVTTRDAIVLDPFMGSGTTGVAAFKEGRRFVGIEREPEYFEIAKTRIDQVARQQELAL